MVTQRIWHVGTTKEVLGSSLDPEFFFLGGVNQGDEGKVFPSHARFLNMPGSSPSIGLCTYCSHHAVGIFYHSFHALPQIPLPQEAFPRSPRHDSGTVVKICIASIITLHHPYICPVVSHPSFLLRYQPWEDRNSCLFVMISFSSTQNRNWHSAGVPYLMNE